jgi:O-acetyl-ADP-ribose deacetylase (regulator of RNase III)
MRHYTNTNNPVDFPVTALKHAKGNLLDMAEAGDFDIVIHGANCFCVMGGGIAREIRERFPMAAMADNETQKGDYNKLGNYTTAFTGKFLIVNAYTQFNMSQGTDVFEYTAFQLILEKILFAFGDKRIGIPYIGMGLAGGDSDTIIPMIRDFADRVDDAGGEVTLVEFG